MALTVICPSRLFLNMYIKTFLIKKKKNQSCNKRNFKPRQEKLGTLELPLWAITKAQGDSKKFKMRVWHS